MTEKLSSEQKLDLILENQDVILENQGLLLANQEDIKIKLEDLLNDGDGFGFEE